MAMGMVTLLQWIISSFNHQCRTVLDDGVNLFGFSGYLMTRLFTNFEVTNFFCSSLLGCHLLNTFTLTANVFLLHQTPHCKIFDMFFFWKFNMACKVCFAEEKGCKQPGLFRATPTTRWVLCPRPLRLTVQSLCQRG